MPTPLSLALLQKAQAEAEGFQNGPAPALNSANSAQLANNFVILR